MYHSKLKEDIDFWSKSQGSALFTNLFLTITPSGKQSSNIIF